MKKTKLDNISSRVLLAFHPPKLAHAILGVPLKSYHPAMYRNLASNVTRLCMPIFAIIFAPVFSIFAISSSASAANPTTLDYSVTIKPSLSLTVSSNNVVLNLNPASNQFGTQDLNISVGTNNSYGYKLYVSSKDNSTELVKDSSTDSINDTIPTLENNTSDTTSDSFPINKWGYKLVSNTTNDIVYKPFTSGLLVSESNTPTNADNSTITFAAKVDYNKPAGTYALDLNFKAVPIVTTYYMQDIAASQTLAESVCTEDPTIVIDKRDERPYTIRRINGTCWMVDNLQFTGTSSDPAGTMTLDSTTSNVASTYTEENPLVLSYGDLTSGNSYDEARLHVGTISTDRSPIDDNTDSTTISTVWYNYAAASAGTITGSSNTDPQVYDICPSGWRMPNYYDAKNVVSYTSLFNPIITEVKIDGNIYYSEGVWWLSTVRNTLGRHAIGYDSTSIYTGGGNRYAGYAVRCVLDDVNIHNLTYMQDFTKLDTASNAKVVNSMEAGIKYTLRDIRDTNTYGIRKFAQNNSIWMINDLQLGYNASNPAQVTISNLNSSNTNIGSARGTISLKLYNLVTYGSSTSGYCYGADSSDVATGAGFVNPCIHSGAVPAAYTYSGSDTTTTWYNYAAASVGTTVGNTGVTGATTEDICPAGWRLPTTDDTAVIADGTNTYASFFEPDRSGSYANSVLYNAGDRGHWITTTSYNNPRRWTLLFVNNGLVNSWGFGGTDRAAGLRIRCILK